QGNIHYVKCRMEDFQYRSYLTVLFSEYAGGLGKRQLNKIFKQADIIDLPNNFFIGTRIISNIAFPNMSIGEKGYNSLDDRAMKHLKKYSIKFYRIINKIKRSPGPVFFYSSFKENGGIKTFAKVLQYYGYKDY